MADGSDRAGEPSGRELRFGRIQRRRLSLMFLDLVNSTRLATGQDLEETRDILLAFLDAANTRIELANGYVARFMGDGLLAYFGYPVSQEEAAANAVAAALEAQQAIGRILTQDGSPLQARIGIATGTVTIGDIVGRGLAAECMAIGVTANLGARLQTSAPPGGVLICEETYRLCGDAFDAERVGPFQLKGFADEVFAWLVTAARDTNRFRNRVGLGLAPLSGRAAELGHLRGAIDALGSGMQSWLISGPAGIGKSRLLYALQGEAGFPHQRWLIGSGAEAASETPFYGLAQILRRLTASNRALSPERQVRRLAALVKRLGMPGSSVDRLAEAAGLPVLNMLAATVGSAETRRGELRRDCVKLIEQATRNGPLVIAIEDAHWLDASTAELIEAVSGEIAQLPVLLVATSRNETETAWKQAQAIQLRELDDAAVGTLAEHAAGRDLRPETIAGIVARSDGNPLYAEELARLLGASEDESGPEIPDSLADLLLCRLDRGTNDLAVSQSIALLGEDAVMRDVAELSGLDRASVDRSIDRLAADGVVRLPNTPDLPLAFRHALFADAAYGSQPKRLRKSAHLVAARLLERRAAPASRIARQYDAGGDAGQAIAWWRSAGEEARSRRAMPEAAAAFARAIILLGEPKAEDGAGQAVQLELHEAQFEALQINHGYAARETTVAGARLRELVERQGDLEQQMVAVAGQWAAASSAGQYDLANRHAARAPAIARALGTADSQAAAAMILMSARYRTGDLIGSEIALQAGLPYFEDPIFIGRAGALAQTFGNAGILHWLLGNDDELCRCLDRLRLALEQLGDPYNRTFTQHMIALVELLRDDSIAAAEAARASLATAETADFPHYLSIARIALGAAEARHADRGTGIAMMRDGLAQMESSSSRSGITLYHSWLAAAEIAEGEADLALGSIGRARRLGPEERYVLPELLRLEAIAEARLGREQRSIAKFREALNVARDHSARGMHRRIRASIEEAGVSV